MSSHQALGDHLVDHILGHRHQVRDTVVAGDAVHLLQRFRVDLAWIMSALMSMYSLIEPSSSTTRIGDLLFLRVGGQEEDLVDDVPVNAAA